MRILHKITFLSLSNIMQKIHTLRITKEKTTLPLSNSKKPFLTNSLVEHQAPHPSPPSPHFSHKQSSYPDSSHTEQQCHPSQYPLGWSLSGLEAEGPDISGSSQLGLVHGTLIDVTRLLSVVRYGSD